MWFKQIQLFQLTQSISSSAQNLADKLESLKFNSCLPSMPSSMGWVSPIDEENEDAPLVRGINNCLMFCLQIEEKILPGSVITHNLKEKMKQIEQRDGRKVRQKEKLTLKDEVTHTLLPRAFTKFTRMHAYIDTKNQWLILNSTSPAKIEMFISLFKKSVTEGIQLMETIKPSAILTQWLKDKNYPDIFSIEKSGVLQDPNQQNRMVRCQQQDLFSESIQSLVKDGCAAIQLALCWQDKLNFVINEDFALKSIHLAEDDITEIYDQLETKQQKFDADFIMMSETFAGLLTDLLAIFGKSKQSENVKKLALTG